MKEGWKIVKLGEVCDFEGGSQPPKSEWTKEPCEGYVRMLQIRDFTQSRKADVEYVKISKKLRLCKANDILIGRYGASVGKILTGLEGAYNVAIIKSIPDETRIIKPYIRRFFEAPNFQSLLFKVCTQRAAQAGFSKEDIVDTEFSLPPLEEQHRIVSILDASFEKIDALKKNAEENLKNAKALFQQVLAQELKPKEGWVEKKLGEFAYMKAGDFVKASDIHTNPDEGLFPCYGGNGLRGYVSEPNQEGDYCLIGRQGALCGCIHRVSGIYRTTEHAVIVKPYEAIPTTLVYYLLISLDLNKYATGAAQPGLSVKNISENVIISIPPLSEQHRIVRTLDTLSEKCRRLEQVAQQTIRECDALKQSILRQAFSGEL